jgi:serine phosphatase RsbU (regulator of sigma subunit)
MRLADVVGSLFPALEQGFPQHIGQIVHEVLAGAVGAQSVAVLLSDYDSDVLRELVADAGAEGRWFAVDGAGPGLAFREQRPQVRHEGAAWFVDLPMSLHGERLGVLVVGLPADPPAEDVDGLHQVATVLAHLLPRLSWYSDQIERTRRVVPLTLPAEIQWSALPQRAFSSPRFDIAGQLCPAYEVGGDIFDYTMDGDVLQVAALDAMGHGLGASLLGSLAVNALRNNRRAGLPMVDQVRGADRVLFGQHGGDRFVCGAFVRLDTLTGAVQLVNAGHPVGALVREGKARMMEVPSQLPMGMFEQTIYEQHDQQLEPGDRLVLVSDGVVEARPADGEQFGDVRLCARLEELAEVTAGETVRRLVRELRDWEGDDLRDDITVVVLDWHGPA